MKSTTRKKLSIIPDLLILILLILTAINYIGTDYILSAYAISFRTLIYTLSLPVDGTSSDVIFDVLEKCYLKIIISVIAIAVVFGIKRYLSRHPEKKWNIRIFSRFTISLRYVYCCAYFIVSIVAFLFSFKYAYKNLDVGEYLLRYTDVSQIYEEHCVQPSDVSISGDNTNNLICIYLESMETKCQYEDGREIKCLPELTTLAHENVSFGKTAEYAGGIIQTTDCENTVGSFVASTSGIPMSVPIFGLSMGSFKYFLPNLQTLGEILNEKGYVQEFILGSEKAFAGTDKYLTQHGNYTIFDYDTAVEKGYTDEYVWWGFEDSLLYEIAKDELAKLSESGKPFNLTLRTVDTHAPAGYTCSKCQNEFEGITGNVVACASKQVYEFIEWVKTQPYYENTTIVLMGDHLRMDDNLAESIERKERRIYNCFINSKVTPVLSDEGRSIAVFDMFPTVLASMGFEIEGNHLGLGTNLFSDCKTLFEEYGTDYVNNELSKRSVYFEDLYY